MLTRLQVRNFKTLEDVDIPLGQNVVLIGPNNSGKTSALQALGLWRTGVIAWERARELGVIRPKLRRFAVINRKDITQTPVSDAASLWRRRETHLSEDREKGDVPITI